MLPLARQFTRYTAGQMINRIMDPDLRNTVERFHGLCVSLLRIDDHKHTIAVLSMFPILCVADRARALLSLPVGSVHGATVMACLTLTYCGVQWLQGKAYASRMLAARERTILRTLHSDFAFNREALGIVAHIDPECAPIVERILRVFEEEERAAANERSATRYEVATRMCQATTM